jgi:hypothetical protein
MSGPISKRQLQCLPIVLNIKFIGEMRCKIEGVPWERWILRNFLKMRVHARPSFIVTINLPSFVTLIRCFIGRSKPLGRLEEFGQAVFHKEVKIQRSPGTPS